MVPAMVEEAYLKKVRVYQEVLPAKPYQKWMGGVMMFWSAIISCDEPSEKELSGRLLLTSKSKV